MSEKQLIKNHFYTDHTVRLLKESPTLYDRPTVDYYEFRNKWLALFNANSNQGLAPLGEWIKEVAWGNPFMPVDVIKDGQSEYDPRYECERLIGGTLMFTVPPILNNNIKISLKDGREVDHVVTHASELSKRMAVAGDKYLQKNLLDNIKIDVPVDPQLSQKMDKIFEHFGIKRTHHLDKKDTEQSKPIEQNPVQSLDNNDLDFDF